MELSSVSFFLLPTSELLGDVLVLLELLESVVVKKLVKPSEGSVVSLPVFGGTGSCDVGGGGLGGACNGMPWARKKGRTAWTIETMERLR